MPLYIPWLTEGLKKRGVRYLLHHYLGQFFEEKLTLEQLSIDIYEGKGSIRDLALDVDGLNDELDFIPFRFLEGCLIGQISVEVPWSSLATDACRVELDGAKFFCRLKTSADASKPHCTESTLLSRSLMTSSMQMAEEIVTTEDDDESESSSIYQSHGSSKNHEINPRKKNANQMLEGLEMFAQLIDSVLRRTKLTARNTLFQIKPYHEESDPEGYNEHETSDSNENNQRDLGASSRSSGDEFSEPIARSGTEDEMTDDNEDADIGTKDAGSKNTVEFFIKFFRCEEMLDQTRTANGTATSSNNYEQDNDGGNKSMSAIPETITKLLTLEDVEMRIDGIPVSNLVGKHTITIKFNGQKSEISIFSGSPLLAVIGHKQLETFFNVFDGVNDRNPDASFLDEKDQKLMSPEDYAKIENQLLESAAALRSVHANDARSTGCSYTIGGTTKSVASSSRNSYYNKAQVLSGTGGNAMRWVESGDLSSEAEFSRAKEPLDYNYSQQRAKLGQQVAPTSDMKQSCDTTASEPTLNHLEAFSCELKLPGIWLCILRDGEKLPALIKPFADSINSFQSVNKYIDSHIKIPHIRFLALKVALDITATGTNIFLGDLDISEHLNDASRMSPVVRILNNDQAEVPMSSSRYKASISSGNEINVELLINTRVMFDPTLIDRIVYDYKLVKLAHQPSQNLTRSSMASNQTVPNQRQNHSTDLNLTIRAEKFKVELLCPIPDLTPEASTKCTQLRPQSFIFDFRDMNMTWRSDRLRMIANELTAFVKTQPKQTDSEAVKFVESSCKGSEKIVLVLEPSPSNLDNDFTNDVEQALNESSMYESIYVSQATESRIPTEPFQTKRKVVRASFQNNNNESNRPEGLRVGACDHEKILTPGDRQHLLEYLEQTVNSTRLSLNLELPMCEVEFEDKEQLDLIYNRFGNDFVFWQPRVLANNKSVANQSGSSSSIKRKSSTKGGRDKSSNETIEFKPVNQYDEHELSSDADNENSDASCQSIVDEAEDGGINAIDLYANEVTCKITVDQLLVKFNHQSCAAALKQAISADNLLLGVVIDVNKKPNTLLSLIADNLELSNELETVLEGNLFCDKQSTFALTAEIKRPTKSLKNIKLAIQLRDGLFNDFRNETYSRFWQSINVTDEPILGYVAPKILTELHVDVLNTGVLLVRDGARPALLSIDELYLTSMLMEQTSQLMIRLIADEVSLYMKRDRQGLSVMKNYICLVDSGLIDMNIKFGGDKHIEFGVINNVITVRVCQDSLSALCKLFNVLVKSASQRNEQTTKVASAERQSGPTRGERAKNVKGHEFGPTNPSDIHRNEHENNDGECRRNREMKLLVDAMNDYAISSTANGNQNDRDDSQGKDKVRPADDVGDRTGGVSGGGETSDSSSISSSGEEDNDDDDDCNEDYDSDAPPTFQRATSARKTRAHDGRAQRDGGSPPQEHCLLDESNSALGDLFSQPLMPMELNSSSLTNMNRSSERDGGGTPAATSDAHNQMASSGQSNQNSAMDESSFFVIGDDDIGAGIIDKEQHEPLVRKLTNEPIQIHENHFKIKRPRTIPEALAASLERYVLEEMTLVINLFGGHDFDDESSSSNEEENENEAHEATNDLLATISSESQLIRSRAGSVACGYRNGDEFGSNSLKRNSLGGAGNLAGARLGGRRKHLSEGSSGPASRLDLASVRKSVEQRVRFGEGAVNLWESLDLISAPDFLGSGPANRAGTILSHDSKQIGGTWRENDVCIQLTLSKVKLLYEVGAVVLPATTASSAHKRPEQSAAADESNPAAPVSWRFMLFIQDIEVKDRIAASDINKMLYEYCNESMPKRSTQMLTVKNVATINPSDGCEECDLRVALKPLRLNIDQDTLLFLLDFFTTFFKSLARQQSVYTSGATNSTTSTSKLATEKCSSENSTASPSKQVSDNSPSVSAKTTTTTPTTTSSSTGSAERTVTRYESASFGRGETRNVACGSRDSFASLASSTSTSSSSGSFVVGRGSLGESDGSSQRGGAQRPAVAATTKSSNGSTGEIKTIYAPSSSAGQQDDELPTHWHTDCDAGERSHQPIYIKSFTFSPDVPIRIDYHAKHLNFEQGALAGILMGLAHLDHSELILRRVHAKHGMRGLERVLVFAINSWLSDIKRNQLPSILSGVGPMHSVIQLFQGLRDLVWMPIDHYRKDGRLVRGLQRGASSFSASTAMAAINLVNRFISIVQCTAQIAHDIVTPPTMSAQRHSSKQRRRSVGKAHRLGSGGGGGAGQSVSSLIGTGPEGCAGGLSGSRRRRYGGGGGHSAQHRHNSGHLEVGSRSSPAAGSVQAGLNQPRNFCEGVAVGFTILKEGFNDTARQVTVGMQGDDMRSAVGGLVRQIPSTLLNPIISATEGAQNVLVGIRNQIAPDARRDDQEKWKGRVRGQ